MLDALLWPAERAYGAGVGLRNLAYDRGWRRTHPAPLPVVSVGNLGVGGAGKTPFAAWLARRLREEGRLPAIAMRGYGKDEVLLHRELNPEIPVFAASLRLEAARAAADSGCEVVVLDDGFQHRALARDLDLVLVSVEGWRERRRLLPRGPWRERGTALRRAHVIVLTRKAAAGDRVAAVRGEVERLAPEVPVVECWIAPSGLARLHGGGEVGVEVLRGTGVLAVAALAEPEPFAEQLREVGAEVELFAFPDHHPFTAREADRLLERAAGRTLVMTRKDAVKLRPLLPPSALAYILEQRVEIVEGAAVLEAALQKILPRATLR